MRASQIKLYNFRNYENEEINFCDGTNIIVGDNGMGKTNIIEALYYFSYGRSFRTSGREIIRTGEKEGRISISFKKDEREFNGDIKFLSGNKKEILLNEIELKKTSQLLGNFMCVLFTPDELRIVKGLPEIRRKFIDSAIMLLKPNYIKELIRYKTILSQKTALLKSKKYSTISVWNEKMAESGSKIMKMRESYIERIKTKASEIQAEITNGKEIIDIIYIPSIKKEEDYIKKLEEYEEKEKENMFCLVGPHRDEIVFEINGKNAKNYASQGQIRTIVLCLKLAQMEIIKEETGKYPVLLLDDILSELDKKRRDFLISKIKDKQIIITCTDIEKSIVDENTNIINIKDGRMV